MKTSSYDAASDHQVTSQFALPLFFSACMSSYFEKCHVKDAQNNHAPPLLLTCDAKALEKAGQIVVKFVKRTLVRMTQFSMILSILPDRKAFS